MFILFSRDSCICFIRVLTEALQICDSVPPENRTLKPEIQQHAGELLLRLGHFEDAGPLLLASHAGFSAALENHRDPDPSEIVVFLETTISLLIDLYDAWDKPDQSALWRARLTEAPAQSR